jgi:subtilisin family serine protease
LHHHDPGTGPDVITVGAIEARPQPAVYEKGSLGPNAAGIMKPDLVAPGINIAAARAGTDADVMSEARSGTSFAAPHVAGCLTHAGARTRISKEGVSQLTPG